MISYREFLVQYGTLPLDAFLEAIQEPYVLVTERETPRDADSGFLTVKFSKESLSSSGEAKSSLLPVRKRSDSNAFAMMITLGRAPNNDMVVDHQKISKFHAYFRQVGSDWVICDANSRNGTAVNGRPVEPGQTGAPVASGTSIKLAKLVDLLFLEPRELYAHIRR